MFAICLPRWRTGGCASRDNGAYGEHREVRCRCRGRRIGGVQNNSVETEVADAGFGAEPARAAGEMNRFATVERGGFTQLSRCLSLGGL